MTEGLDPVSVSTVIITALFGSKVAFYLGPYLIIGCAGLSGAVFSLGRRKQTSKIRPGTFLILMTTFSLLLTIPIAQFMTYIWANLNVQWILAPLALMVGYIGDNWPGIWKWMGGILKRLIESRTGEHS